jgi:hypothetical protein
MLQTIVIYSYEYLLSSFEGVVCFCLLQLKRGPAPMVSDNIDLDTPDPFAPTPPRQPQGELSLADARARLKTLGVCFTQPTPTQIKVGPINFWPQGKGGGGRIHIDGCTKHPEQGWEAFIKLLQRHGLMRPLK